MPAFAPELRTPIAEFLNGLFFGQPRRCGRNLVGNPFRKSEFLGDVAARSSVDFVNLGEPLL